MKTIWIPDIHNKIGVADKIVTSHGERPLRVVYAGDYFDNFNDTPAHAQRVAEWLVTHCRNDVTEQKEGLTRVFLVGNHDVPYLFPNLNKAMWCPGYTPEKALAVASTGLHHLTYHFNLFNVVGSWLCTHAGVSGELFKDDYGDKNSGYTYPTQSELLDLLLEEEELLFEHKYVDPRALIFMQEGYRTDERRSGRGGLTWCDWDNEFEPIPGINQLVGHTPHPTVKGNDITGPEFNSFNTCSDTHLRTYGVYDEVADTWDWRKV